MILLGLSYSMLGPSLWPMVSLIVPKYQLGTAFGLYKSFLIEIILPAIFNYRNIFLIKPKNAEYSIYRISPDGYSNGYNSGYERLFYT